MNLTKTKRLFRKPKKIDERTVSKTLYNRRSGLNLNKRGIKKIIHMAISGKVNELVIAYRVNSVWL